MSTVQYNTVQGDGQTFAGLWCYRPMGFQWTLHMCVKKWKLWLLKASHIHLFGTHHILQWHVKKNTVTTHQSSCKILAPSQQ